MRAVNELIADSPSAVTAFNDMYQTGLVTTVGVIIHSKEVTIVVKGEFLWVSQTSGIQFQVRTIEVTS